MNPTRSLPRLTIVLLFLFLAGYACTEKKATPPSPTITIDNLQTAYAKALKHQDMYKRFAAQAEKEHFGVVVRLYSALARSEEIHAANHARLLRTYGAEPIAPRLDPVVVGKAMQTLKMAFSSEGIEAGSLYPNIIKAAKAENASEAVQQFSCLRDADARHAELIDKAIQARGTPAVQTFFVCPSCGLIMTPDNLADCAGCKTEKAAYERF